MNFGIQGILNFGMGLMHDTEIYISSLFGVFPIITTGKVRYGTGY